MGEGVDHRQVQRELGDVSIYLQKPVIRSPTSASLSWTVSVHRPCTFKPPCIHRTTTKNAKAAPLLFSRWPVCLVTFRATAFFTEPSAAPGRSRMWTRLRTTASFSQTCRVLQNTRSRYAPTLTSYRVTTAS